MRAKASGFSMIELLMVITVVGILAAVAVPQFLDFRKEAKVAATRFILGSLRVGIKNQLANARLRCGYIDADLASDPNGQFNKLAYNFYNNDITSREYQVTKVCAASEVPVVSERRFWDFPDAQVAHGYIAGADSGVGKIPANPFITSTSATTVISIASGIRNALVVSFGGHCQTADHYALSNVASHWYFDLDTGEIWAGTNTAGVNECNL